MPVLRKLLVAMIWFSIARYSHAQTHYNIWFRATLSLPVEKRIKIEAELQHRRQSGFANNNMFDSNLMFSVRSWIHYRQNNHLTFSLSPFAYFSNYPLILKKTDETSSPGSEIRFSGAVSVKDELAPGLLLVTRSALEYRLPDNARNITRGRQRLGLQYMFSSSAGLSVLNEVLFNITGVSGHHFFDHNRLGIELEHTLLPSAKIVIGYLHIDRLPLRGTDTINEHNLFINLTMQLPNR